MTSQPTSDPRPLIIGIGEILWDMLPSGKQLGGAPANFAYHAQALGARAIIVSAIGRDDQGCEILARLDALGIDRSCIATDPSHPTGTVDVQLDAKGVPTFIIHTDVAWDFIPMDDNLLSLASQAHAVCFGSLAQRSPASRDAIRRFLTATGPQCPRIFDINFRQSYFDRDAIEQSLNLTDVLKLNDQELPVLGRLLEIGAEDEEIIGNLMYNYPLRLIAVTRGPDGSRLYYPGGRLYEESGHPTKVIDTVGAGDAFAAALAMGILRGDPPELINFTANRLASYVCSQCGATPPIPADLFTRREDL